MKKYKVVFKHLEQSIDVSEGTTLIKAIRDGGIDFDFPCGGVGKCGKCKVRILEGEIKPNSDEIKFLNEDEINQGIHLACFTEIWGDMVVDTLGTSSKSHNILLTSEEKEVSIDPHISKTYVQVKKPSLGEWESDWQRLTNSLFNEYTSTENTKIEILQKLPNILRKNDNCITAITYDKSILGIEANDTTNRLTGMAFDIGTTTIVGYLIDMHTGKELQVVSTLNSQTKYGADVITRSNYAGKEENGLRNLHVEVIDDIDELIHEACDKAGIKREDIYSISIVGNTCMHHLFLGISPSYVAKAPYIPAISEPVVLDAKDLAIEINDAGKVFVLPNIAGFVGADTVSAILATEMDKSNHIKLMIDIGTNGEIALGCGERLLACSAAAGPAFEGAEISSGMRGAEGAIDHVVFGEKLEISVVGNGKPKGICGSGLLDAVAGLIEIGILDKRGKFLSIEKITNPKAEVFKNNIVDYDGAKAFLLADENNTSHKKPIMITQKDIRQLQMAKGAMSAAIKILMDKYGINVDEIEEVLLAGAFGNYMNPHSACVIGLIPKELEGKIKMVGNAAGSGSKLSLLSKNEYKRAERIGGFVEFVELATYPNFSSIFSKSMYF
jgi:uncharacterized 2Fe-2S/4Fe-4S cluster protein (DUF4445 family)